MKQYVLYSHGFGVDKTDRGLMTDIATSMPQAEHILFDYNEVDYTNKELRVNTLQEQARRLQNELAVLNEGSEKIIDIVAHSQGCIIAALVEPHYVRRMIFLAPPDNLNIDQMVTIFGSRPGSHIDTRSESRIQRRDGTTTIIPKEYWKSLRVNVMQLYNNLSDHVEAVSFYIANNDEVLGDTDFDQIDQRVDLTHINGGHDFTGEARTEITKAIKASLSI